MGSDEFFNNQGGGTNTGFLAALYQDLLGRSVDAAGSLFFGTALANGTPRTQVIQLILQSQEFDQVLVKGFYSRFLQRPGDMGGVSFFANQLQQGMPESSVLAAIIGSEEFFELSQ